MPYRRLTIPLIALVFVFLQRGSSVAQVPPDLNLEIPVTVSEWSNLSRTDESVTSGIPIPLTATQSAFALFDGPTEVPVQTILLPGIKTPWVLLDFQTTLTAGQSKTYTLKAQSPTAAVAQPLTFSEDSSQITVTSGAFRTQLSKTNFNLLDTVWLDSNTDGTFTNDERVLLPNVSSNLAVVEASLGNTYSGQGQATSFAWEYQGPLRATLRVDGNYVGPSINGSTTLLQYSSRFTFVAGQTSVKIEHLIRNSSPTQERYVKLRSAKLNVGTTTTTDRIARSGDVVWANVSGGTNFSLELIPPTLDVSTDYAPYVLPPVWRQNATVNIDTSGGGSGGLIIGDLSYHGATSQVDFATGLSTPEKTRRTNVFKDPLLARAPEAWYSELGALGYRFSTYADEKNSNIKWGWTWPTPSNPWSYEPNLPRRPNLYPSWSIVDGANDPESDDLHENIIMMIRTGLPYYLDRVRGWARYTKSEAYFRTDGYTYAGAWDNFWDGPGTVDRPVVAPTLHENDSDYIDHNMKYGKFTPDHIWNGGILEYYYLTGDKDALSAGLDGAEECKRYFDWQYLPLHGIGGTARGPGRCLLMLLNAWQVTNDQQWKTSADHIQTLFLQSTRYDPRGFYAGNLCENPNSEACQRFPNGKHFTPFQIAVAMESLYHYYLLTDDQATKNRLIAVATFVRDNLFDANGYGAEEYIIDWPTPGAVSRLTTAEFRNLPPFPSIHGALTSRDFVNTLVIAYRLTGDHSFLRTAKTAWGRATKGNPGSLIATETQVGNWANSQQAWGPDGILFPNGGDWTYVSYLFYEAYRADDIPPGPINDLAPSG